MNKIISVDEAVILSKKLRDTGKTTVLVGGCFDIIHVGHIHFLKAAKNQGDYLLVVLESNESMKKKGVQRPIFDQKERAAVLEAIRYVDYIVLLPPMPSDLAYDDLINSLKPTIIATTKGDPHRHHKERQAKSSGGTVIDVIERISNTSTSHIAKLLSNKQDL